MPQLILPTIPIGSTLISEALSVYRTDTEWTYYLGVYSIYSHKSDDLQMFRFVTSKMIESGTCRHGDIARAFGVSKSSVNRSLKKLREEGASAFFKPRSRRSGGSILTQEKLEEAQKLLNQGLHRYEVADELEVPHDTFRKAINDGRLTERVQTGNPTTKTDRTVKDAKASDGMGTACTRQLERVMAAKGLLDGVISRFEPCFNVSKGGVLTALPSLLMNGLLNGAMTHLGKISGYYTMFHVLLLLAYMALCRVKKVAQLASQAPGEMGKLMGLDRVPEVKCLREKLDQLSSGQAAEKWAIHLSQYWMKENPESVGTLYIDGHVRVYHGNLTRLPRRYVSRERLCLRGITDYYVNDIYGRPFFFVDKIVDPGLLQVLRNEIIPRLLRDIPNQPSQEVLDANPYTSRFILVFDREGYSPAFFKEMWQTHRIACITYHKFPGEVWPKDWFHEKKVNMPNGEEVTMSIAEMGSLIGSNKKDAIFVKEIRKLTTSGHQTSLISTAYDIHQQGLAIRMFSRWCQENFFQYMMRHFAIDLLEQYGVDDLPDTEMVINPVFRNMQKLQNSIQNKLRYRHDQFAKMILHPQSTDDSKKYEKWIQKKSNLLEEIQQFENQLSTLKIEIKDTPKHISWENLDKNEKFHRLRPERKKLLDTIRLIAYRAETAMVPLLKSPTVDSAEARKLLQNLFVTDADIIPDSKNKTLSVIVHNASTPKANTSIKKLFEQLNKAETIYPGTDLNIQYQLRGKGD